jgi:hypothetical protein
LEIYMADKKISALPAASTPLAGSEVLPIVQGGITEQVSVANLTAGRGVSGSSFTTTAGNFVAAENFGLSFGVGSTYVYGSTTNGFIRLDVNNATAFGVDSSRNATVSVGNLIIGTAGKGIDFSAATHAAGMTSELLNDYEEGTWTPTQGANLTVIGDFSSSGTYTKIGRLVMVRGVLSATTSLAYASTAAVICGGLPFSSAASCLGLAFNQGFNTTSTVVADTGTNVVAVTAMGATPQIIFTATYYV